MQDPADPGLSRHFPEQTRAALGAATLDRSLLALWERAHRAHPDFGLSQADFIAQLGRKSLKLKAASELEQLFAADLYLALACAAADPLAAQWLDEILLPQVLPDIRRVVGDPDSAAEVLQLLRIALLLESDGHPAKLLGYDGRGPLVSWLRTAAIRAALLHLRKDRSELASAMDLQRLPEQLAGPDLALLKRRHQGDLKRAFADVLLELSAQERMVLRLRHLNGMSLEEISLFLGLHRSTVVRTLASLREALLAGTRKRLKAMFGLGSRDLDSLLTLLASDLNLSLERLLNAFELPGT